MKRIALAWLAVVVALAVPLGASAEASSEDQALFDTAVHGMKEGKPGEAIVNLEALADHGVIDATVSFDRGLAYVSRVRVGGEQPGDLGEAAHGFVEAERLTNDRGLRAEARRALGLVRAEVGRRRARAGQPVDFDPGLALGPTFLRLLPEDGWALVGLVGSLALGAALFVWRAAKERRSQIAAQVTAVVATLVMAVGTASLFAARHQRETTTAGVIVVAGARPTDDRGHVLPNAPFVPEAAEVEIVGHRAGWAEVRWGNLKAWVPSGAVRPVAD